MLIFRYFKKIPSLLEQSILKERSFADRYRTAFALSSFFLFISSLLHHQQYFYIPPSVSFSVNLLASLLATVYGGIGPGFFSTIVSRLGLNILALHPTVLGNVNFVFTSLVVNVLVSCLKSSYRMANKAMAEAERSKHVMDDFIATVSHDLKTPLTTIGLKADLLLKTGGIQANDKNHVEEMKKTAGNMALFINHLLDFEKIKNGRLIISSLKVENMNEVLSEVISTMEPLAAQKSIQLRYSIDDVFIPVKCDRIRMRQVFSNLIENAIKYSSRSDSVLIEARVLGNQLRCLIADSGPGIEAQNLPHVFDPFWQARNSPGAGLGLSIVKGILDAHGTEIFVSSQLNVGTSFVFTLPITSKETVQSILPH